MPGLAAASLGRKPPCAISRTITEHYKELLVALACALVALWGADRMVHILWLVLTGQRTPAVFVANYQYVDSRHRPSSFFPVVRFTVPHGHTHVVRTTSGTTPPEFAVGHHVTVIYDPHHPETAFIDSWHDLWEGPLMMIGTGTLFALAFLRAALAERTPDAD